MQLKFYTMEKGLLIACFVFTMSIIYAQNLPIFKLTSLAGDTISSESFRGKPVYINVFETYCAPCIAEMPELNKLKEKHPAVVFIALTPAKQSKVLKFKKKTPVNFTVISDASDLCTKLKVRGYPTHFFVDKVGTLHNFNATTVMRWDHTPTKEEVLARYREINYSRLDSVMTKYENE